MLELVLLPVLGIALAIAGGIAYFTRMPGRSFSGPGDPLSAGEQEVRERLRAHVGVLANDIGERNMTAYSGLLAAARYIEETMAGYGFEPLSQPYQVDGQEVRNIEATVSGGGSDEIVVIGAHYDTVFGCPGANDNGSGVAALLELARTFQARRPSRTIRFVAFVNEEPPYFLTEDMGSNLYAMRCREHGDKITAMLSLETIGYYSDKPGSQEYPSVFGSLYPDTANFISFVSNPRSSKLLRRVVATFRRTAKLPSEGGAAPEAIPGIAWSDHWSFWQQGYSAIMVTDTALYRYPWYHTPGDTPEKLDYDRMARLVVGLVDVVADLAGQ